MFLELHRGKRSLIVNMGDVEEILPCSDAGGAALYMKGAGDGARLVDESPFEIANMALGFDDACADKTI